MFLSRLKPGVEAHEIVRDTSGWLLASIVKLHFPVLNMRVFFDEVRGTSLIYIYFLGSPRFPFTGYQSLHRRFEGRPTGDQACLWGKLALLTLLHLFFYGLCQIIHHLSEALWENEVATEEESPMDPYFQRLVDALIAVTERRDWQEQNIRSQAYEAIHSLIQRSSDKVSDQMFELLKRAVSRLIGVLDVDVSCYMPRFTCL